MNDNTFLQSITGNIKQQNQITNQSKLGAGNTSKDFNMDEFNYNPSGASKRPDSIGSRMSNDSFKYNWSCLYYLIFLYIYIWPLLFMNP